MQTLYGHFHTRTPLQDGQVTVSLNFKETEKVKQMRKQKNMFQVKEQETKKQKKLKPEINNLPDKEFQALIVRMLTEQGKE